MQPGRAYDLPRLHKKRGLGGSQKIFIGRFSYFPGAVSLDHWFLCSLVITTLTCGTKGLDEVAYVFIFFSLTPSSGFLFLLNRASARVLPFTSAYLRFSDVPAVGSL